MELVDFNKPVIFWKSTLYKTGIRTAPARPYHHSYLGGPVEGVGGYPQKISNVSCEPTTLHRVLTLNSDVVDGLGSFSPIPIIYGLRYSGCDLSYKLGSLNLELSHFSGELINDWPYANYPPILPYYPLELIRRSPCSLDEFENRYTWQGLSGNSENLFVVIPAHSIPGVHLWGVGGEVVIIVSELDTATGKVSVSNQCD